MPACHYKPCHLNRSTFSIDWLVYLFLFQVLSLGPETGTPKWVLKKSKISYSFSVPKAQTKQQPGGNSPHPIAGQTILGGLAGQVVQADVHNPLGTDPPSPLDKN